MEQDINNELINQVPSNNEVHIWQCYYKPCGTSTNSRSMTGDISDDTKNYIYQNGTAISNFSSEWFNDTAPTSGSDKISTYFCLNRNKTFDYFTAKATMYMKYMFSNGSGTDNRKYWQSGSSSAVGTIVSGAYATTATWTNPNDNYIHAICYRPDVGQIVFCDASRTETSSQWTLPTFGGANIINTIFPIGTAYLSSTYGYGAGTKTLTCISGYWYTTAASWETDFVWTNSTSNIVKATITQSYYLYNSSTKYTATLVNNQVVLPGGKVTGVLKHLDNSLTQYSTVTLTYTTPNQTLISADSTNGIANHFSCTTSSGTVATSNTNNYFIYDYTVSKALTLTFKCKSASTTNWLGYALQYGTAVSTSNAITYSYTPSSGVKTLNMTSTAKKLGPALFPIIKEPYSNPPHNFGVTWYVNNTTLTPTVSGTSNYYLGYTLPVLSDYSTSTKLNSCTIQCLVGSNSNGRLLTFNGKSYCIPGYFTTSTVNLFTVAATTYKNATQAYTYDASITVDSTHNLTISNIKNYLNGTTSNGTLVDINIAITSNGITATNTISSGYTSATATYKYASGVASTVKITISGDYYFIVNSKAVQEYSTTIAANSINPTITLPSIMYYKTRQCTAIKPIENGAEVETSSHVYTCINGAQYPLETTYPFTKDCSIVSELSMSGLIVSGSHFVDENYRDTGDGQSKVYFSETGTGTIATFPHIRYCTYKTVYAVVNNSITDATKLIKTNKSYGNAVFNNSGAIDWSFEQDLVDGSGAFTSEKKLLAYSTNDKYEKIYNYYFMDYGTNNTWDKVLSASFNVPLTQNNSWLQDEKLFWIINSTTLGGTANDAKYSGSIFSDNVLPDNGFYDGKNYWPNEASKSSYTGILPRICYDFNIKSDCLKVVATANTIVGSATPATFTTENKLDNFFVAKGDSYIYTITNNSTVPKKITATNSSSSNADTFTAILKAGESTTWTTTGADGGSITAEDVPCNVYVKVNGNWILGTSVYVKQNGEWKQSTSPAYAKVSGTWKTQ